jgi:hypothetical protein
MSIISVRTALEAKLNAMTPSIQTSWENVPYTPVSGTAYQAAYLLPVTENPTMGDDHHRLIGIFQINLFYPLLTGTLTAATRAELIKTTFKRGTSMTSGSVTVIVERTPDIGQGRPDGDRFMIPIKIRWYAEVFA